MSTVLNVLIFSGSARQEGLVLDELRGGVFNPTSRRVGDIEEMREALDSAEWDIIFHDHEFDGDVNAVLIARGTQADDIPVILMSDAAGLESLVRLIHNGVSDFVSRSNVAGILPAVERALVERDRRRRQRQDEEEIRRQATFDQLTDLPNRRLFFDRLTQAMKRSRRQGGLLSVLFVDVDELKTINDTFGHPVGDGVLREVGRRLGASIRDSDTAARIGGDEFAIILDGVASAETGEGVAQKVLENLSRPFCVNECETSVTASIGIAYYPRDGEDAESLLRNADNAMYQVKNTGRNGYRIYSSELTAARADQSARRHGRDGAGVVRPMSSARDEDIVRRHLAWLPQIDRSVPRLSTWVAATPLWAVVILAGWIVVSSLYSVLQPGGLQLIADENFSVEWNFDTAAGADEDTSSVPVKPGEPQESLFRD